MDIDKYRLTSLEEPTDEMLQQIMHEVAVEAKRKGEEAHRKYFDQLRKDAIEQAKLWFENNPAPVFLK